MSEPELHPPSRSLPRWMVVGFVLTGIASFSGLSFMLYTAIRMVASGRGLETYRTFWLVEFNWIGFLVLTATFVLALIAIFVLNLREKLLWRSLERKYGGEQKGT